MQYSFVNVIELLYNFALLYSLFPYFNKLFDATYLKILFSRISEFISYNSDSFLSVNQYKFILEGTLTSFNIYNYFCCIKTWEDICIDLNIRGTL